MPRLPLRHLARVFALAGLLAAGPASPSVAQPAPPAIAADAQHIRLTLPQPAPADHHLVALAAYEADDDPGLPLDTPGNATTIELPRLVDGRDLLLHRFVWRSKDDEKPYTQGQNEANPSPHATWVTDIDHLPRYDQPMPWPKSIKGVSNPLDLDDLVALGVKHVHINLSLSDLLLPAGEPDPGPDFLRHVGDQAVRLNPQTVADWDQEIAGLTDAGINVVAVILNGLPKPGDPTNALVHPGTNLEQAPHRLGAFNLTDEAGVAAYVATLSFLADRYSQPGHPHGWIGGYIIGNEVDSHWQWHNMGEVGLDQIADHYHQALRLAWLAIRQASTEPRVFASLTHSWSRPNSRDPQKNTAGRDLLDRLHQLGAQGGDFGWDLAYHPYPQNLFEPRFWNDVLAMQGYDTPMITFKNIEVLAGYLDQPARQYQGQPRRIILSEQGLHSPAGEEGGKLQAAAIALAYHRIEQTPGIAAFILHRHVDSTEEGGLLLGLRHPPSDGKPMGGRKASWDVFADLGQPGWRDRQRFALEIANLDSWDQMSPRPAPFPDSAPEWELFPKPADVFADLIQLTDDATIDSALQVASRVAHLPDGGLAEGLMLHPKDADQPAATIAYRLDLPADRSARFEFQTYLAKAEGDGVVFRVRVDDTTLFEQTVADQSITSHRVDLSAYRGQSISLVLEVDCRRHNQYDEAVWLQPVVVLTGDAAAD